MNVDLDPANQRAEQDGDNEMFQSYCCFIELVSSARFKVIFDVRWEIRTDIPVLKLIF